MVLYTLTPHLVIDRKAPTGSVYRFVNLAKKGEPGELWHAGLQSAGESLADSAEAK
jgi:hypothetical protein